MMGNNEEITKVDAEIETQKETEVVEKKSIRTKIGEFAGKVANSKVCRTVGKGVILAGAVAGGVVLGKHLNKKSEDEANDYYDVEIDGSDDSTEA